MITLEIGLVLLLILFNAFFAMSELAILSARRARLQQRADTGSVGARVALLLSDNPTRFLSTVQIGITLVGILAGAFSGATIAESFAAYLERHGMSPGAAGPLAITSPRLSTTSTRADAHSASGVELVRAHLR